MAMQRAKGNLSSPPPPPSLINSYFYHLGLFSHKSNSAQFEFVFELRNLNDHSNDRILDRVYVKLHRDASFEMRNSNEGPEVFSQLRINLSNHAAKLPYKCFDL